VLGSDPAGKEYRRFGDANVAAHRAIVAAIRKKDADAVRQLMLEHIVEAERYVRRLNADVSRRLVLDSDLRMNVTPRISGNN
jgi:DNA-binding FadR family transcriptional regulator